MRAMIVATLGVIRLWDSRLLLRTTPSRRLTLELVVISPTARRCRRRPRLRKSMGSP